MDDLTAWGILVGMAAPLVIAIVQRPGWSNTSRVVVSVLFCAVAGGVTAVLDGTISGVPVTFSGVVQTAVAVILAAQVAYRNWWKPMGTTDVIEAATSPASDTRD